MTLSTNNIIIEAGEARYCFTFMEWDSEFFECPCYVLDSVNSRLIPDNRIARQFRPQFEDAFITAKIDTTIDYSVLQTLQDGGFRYIDTEITLEHSRDGSYTNNINETVIVEKTHQNNNLPYDAFGSVYSLTRFHTDPHIRNNKADQLWIDYLKNYVPDDHHHMFVARFHGEVAGVILANLDNRTETVHLFYVSALPEFQGMGIGSALIQHVVSHFNGYIVRTGTQSKNINALNFYLDNGFKNIPYSKTVFHYWSGKKK